MQLGERNPPGQDRLRKHHYRKGPVVTKPATSWAAAAGARTARLGTPSLQEGRRRHHSLSPHATWMAPEKAEPAPSRRCAAKWPHQQAHAAGRELLTGYRAQQFHKGLAQTAGRGPRAVRTGLCRDVQNGSRQGPEQPDPTVGFGDGLEQTS